jgi:hypothetical protein
MKSLLALMLLTLSMLSYAQPGPNDFGASTLDILVRAGRLTLVAGQEMTRPFGQPGKWVFQNGRLVTNNRLDRGAPSCEVTVASTFQHEMRNSYFRAGQQLGNARMEASGSSFNLGRFSRERANVTITFMGNIQDATRTGMTDEDQISIAEIMPGSLQVVMECRGFRTDTPTGTDLSNVLGDSVFDIQYTPFDARGSMLSTVSGQRIRREQEAAEEARRIAREAEVARLNAEREARIQAEVERIRAEREARAQAERERLAREQAEREAAARLSILTALDQVSPALPATFRVSEIRDTAIIGIGTGLSSTVINGANNRFNGNIFQNGEHVGYVHQNGDLYTVNEKTIDHESPNCRVQGTQYMVRPRSQQIDVQSGIFEIERVHYFSALRSISLSIVARDELTTSQEGFSKLVIDCRNVDSLEDVQRALGAERFNLRQADAEGVVAEVDSDRSVQELDLEELARPVATSGASNQ